MTYHLLFFQTIRKTDFNSVVIRIVHYVKELMWSQYCHVGGDIEENRMNV